MTQRLLAFPIFVLAGLLATGSSLRADVSPQSETPPDFKEVYELLRANLAGAADADLNRAAVEGLLAQLHGKASLVGDAAESATNAPLSKAMILADDVAYLRAARVGGELAKAARAAYRQLNATNKLKGVVLDLRFADGDDYAVAAATADLFMAREHPLLDWGNGMVNSKAKTNAIPGPLVVLVNGETRGAAEALAAVLRDAGMGLLMGNPTVGQAMMTKDFPLQNGERLRIATTPVKLGNGTNLSRVLPDIAVTVSLADERAYFENPFAALAKTDALADAGVATNRLPVNVEHIREADLVHERRSGGNAGDGLAPERDPEPQKPALRDPALARAVDLLKGLAAVQTPRP
jgi:hypothetical protein